MKRAARTVFVLLFFLYPNILAASDYPNRPIRLFLSSAPGGILDLTTRLFGAHLSKQVSQPVIVENKPGAGGLLASQLVTRAKPDGYTVLLTTQALSTFKAFVKNPGVNPVEDFSFVTTLTNATFVI